MMPTTNFAPRVVVAGLSGDSGKTFVSLALLLRAQQQGIPATAFKKGPDYIDAGWLRWATGNAVRNLDTYLMGPQKVARLFSTHAFSQGLNVVEGNRGLFDGFDEYGTHSTAQLAKLLQAPVLLVVDSTKLTHTIAALVLGCQTLDPALDIRGVILNRISGQRHERILTRSVESHCGLPVVGVIPRIEAGTVLPGRHLGLVTAEEHGHLADLAALMVSLGPSALDLKRILEIASSAPALEVHGEKPRSAPNGTALRIGYLRDSAFTFYYPDNLEAIERSGARLEPITALSAESLPGDLDALYMGGGFPETHAAALAANSAFRNSVRRAALEGLPIYAECGGLMFLARSLRWRGESFPMAGVLPFDIEVCAAPQGHGYVELLVDRPNPYYPVGAKLVGHEFHYSKILPVSEAPATVCAVKRGAGALEGRDAVMVKNVWASYFHVHAVATPEWTTGLLRAARSYAAGRRKVSSPRGRVTSASGQRGRCEAQIGGGRLIA